VVTQIEVAVVLLDISAPPVVWWKWQLVVKSPVQAACWGSTFWSWSHALDVSMRVQLSGLQSFAQGSWGLREVSGSCQGIKPLKSLYLCTFVLFVVLESTGAQTQGLMFARQALYHLPFYQPTIYLFIYSFIYLFIGRTRV
jgi:hypothetical protein